MKVLIDHIRAAGGIVHKDGNIFFTNEAKLNHAVELAVANIGTGVDADVYQFRPKMSEHPMDSWWRDCPPSTMRYMRSCPDSDRYDYRVMFSPLRLAAHANATFDIGRLISPLEVLRAITADGYLSDSNMSRATAVLQRHNVPVDQSLDTSRRRFENFMHVRSPDLSFMKDEAGDQDLHRA